MFRRQGRRTNPDGLSQSVELHEAASPYRHPRYHRPSAKEKLIPLVRSAATGRSATVSPAHWDRRIASTGRISGRSLVDPQPSSRLSTYRPVGSRVSRHTNDRFGYTPKKLFLVSH